jgi:cobalt-precorrin 5A hydrolase/precorrin-3B C17-methyltransferase
MAGVTSVQPPVAVLALSEPAAKLARRIRRALSGAKLHGLEARVARPDVAFADTTAHLQRLFQSNTPIVGVCAAGILMRAVAPFVKSKREEPPVIAVGADGKSVVPLLGGHGGGNRMALRIAKAIGARAAITTAGDAALGIALDDPPAGWRVANPKAAKGIAAALLAKMPVSVEVDEGFKHRWIAKLRRLDSPGPAMGMIRVTARTGRAGGALIIHPPVLALGVGCERGADPEEVVALARRTLKTAKLAEGAVACVASLNLKADEPAIQAVADYFGVPARFYLAEALEGQAARLANPSDIVFQAVGTHGVAEGAALAGAGRKGKLLVPKAKSKRATCAVGWSPEPIDFNRTGLPRGWLRIVGIGPGDADWRTSEATRAVELAEHLVGYGPYLDLLGDAARGKRRHKLDLGEEEKRSRLALDLAAGGRRVALICSGDAGVYGMASLVLELMAREEKGEWNRIDLAVVPGLSALLAAAARAGAPLGHDFCAISLSDLLTRRETIEARLRAAAAADFVIVLYNPASQRRRDLLIQAREILLSARPTSTPVIVARNLGRAGEQVAITTLADFDPARVDMLTLVIVGSSATRLARHGGRDWVHTPRGYAAKVAR